MRNWSAVTVMAFLAGCAVSEDRSAPSIEIMGYGILEHAQLIGARIPASKDENHGMGEPQPGTDTFELYLGYRKLAEKTFQIERE